MAKAGAVTAVLAMFGQPEKGDFCRGTKSRTLQGWCPCTDETRWWLSSEYEGTAAQQRGMDDCGYQDKIQPPIKAKHTLSRVLLSSSRVRQQLNSSRQPLAVGTLEFHFLLLFQSLSHPSFAVVCSSLVILLTDLSSACPCLLSCC